MAGRRTTSDAGLRVEQARREAYEADQKALRSLQEGLRIDRDNLDGCLIEQPDRYYRVADAHARAIADRDATKLEQEEVVARLDREIRDEATRTEKKITESAIQQEIKLDSNYRAVRQRLQELTADVDALQALKEAFQQRSFMLRELVALVIAERSDQAGAGGAYEARARRAEFGAAVRSEALRAERGGIGAAVRSEALRAERDRG